MICNYINWNLLLKFLEETKSAKSIENSKF